MPGTEQVCQESEDPVQGSALPGMSAGKGRAALLQALQGAHSPTLQIRKTRLSKFKELAQDHPLNNGTVSAG